MVPISAAMAMALVMMAMPRAGTSAHAFAQWFMAEAIKPNLPFCETPFSMSPVVAQVPHPPHLALPPIPGALLMAVTEYIYHCPPRLFLWRVLWPIAMFEHFLKRWLVNT